MGRRHYADAKDFGAHAFDDFGYIVKIRSPLTEYHSQLSDMRPQDRWMLLILPEGQNTPALTTP